MGWTSQFVAGERVENASPEEESADHEEGDVEHGNSPVTISRRTREFDPISDRILPGCDVMEGQGSEVVI
jgi:hypothetical protein